MATIITKNSSTASSVPLAAQLVQGELAVNVTDKRLFTENNGGTVVELGTNPSTLVVASGATIQGLTVGRGAGSVSTNTAVGNSAMTTNSTGARNTGLGYFAVQTNSTSNDNTGLGYAALYQTTGATNTGIGSQSLISNTTGASNAALGYNSLNASTTGSFNVAIGTQALQANTTADNNTAVGYQAVYNNTTGTSLVAVGRMALRANTTGGDNSALGINALYSNTTGGSNTSIGASALFSNTTASYNTAVGYQAGYTSTTATNNTLIGAVAGTALTGGGNTFIGAGVGQVITTGSKNTIIGTYNGNQGGLDIRTASNYIVLSDGDGNPRVTVNGSGAITFKKVAFDYTTLGGFFDGATFNSAGTGDFLNCYSTTSSAYRFYVSQVGTVYATSTTISSISDIRFKENVRDLNVGLAEVMALKPRLYDWKEGKGANIKNARGFIAQEFEEVFPDLIDEWKDEAPEGEEPYKSVRQDLIPVLVKAIQELNAKVEAQAAEIATLKGN